MDVARVLTRVAMYVAKTERREPLPMAAGRRPLPPDFATEVLLNMIDEFIGIVKARVGSFVHASTRVPDASDIDACLCMSDAGQGQGQGQRPKAIGKGFFGTVFEITARTCAPAFPRPKKTAPSSKPKFAVKVVRLVRNQWKTLDQAVNEWNEEGRIATLAGNLGVGPKVHRYFVCSREPIKEETVGVLVMDVVHGVKLSEWRKTASVKDRQAADTMIKEQVRKLHGAGIVHGDLHAGNVLIVQAPGKKSDQGVAAAFILDYGMASSVAVLQNADLEDLEGLVDGRLPVDGSLATRILEAMVADRTIRLPAGRVMKQLQGA